MDGTIERLVRVDITFTTWLSQIKGKMKLNVTVKMVEEEE